ncbi:family 43 glycosylhydrolase [Luteolibacter pohnpeiensis]|uniref:Family 43 glycosylhydrolase n=1 Tax=Luteolibacter pohnpeiensis TaxID=454153 RepID=A0A934S706_9BACT|nr:family 43 glycosylhydrolase [Luteolibacter pohnpeiensis]MBK1883826.1 family 43 glycosylhydrolase [Luteolibacter pohnpeiensis]
MKPNLSRIFFLLLPACLTTASLANPVFLGADPHVTVFDGKYWGYPTHTTDAKAQFHAFDFMAYSSKDLVHWEEHGPILKIEDISWIKDDGAPDHWLWAPGITEKDGKYYFYYSVGPQNPAPSRIGVAVADSPAGQFKDSGKPLLTGGNGFEAIDPMVFQDKDGTAYFYAGGSSGAKLRVWKLKPNLIELGEEIKVDTPPEFTEGAFMHEIDGTYYLSYSHGGWNLPNYSVHYAISKSPTGPWEYKGAILNSDGTHKGPGHHSFFKNPSTGQWYIAYHYWPSTKPEGPLEGIRQTAIQPVTFEKDGTIKKVIPNDEGPAAAPIR